MIRKQEELAVIRKQLSRIENALASLRARVKNEHNFAVYSEGYVDQIAVLRAEIDTYRKAKKNSKAGGKNQKRRRRKAS